MIPKFRAWDKEYEDMHDVCCIDFHNKAVKTLDPMVGHCFWTTMQGKILMQSTGLIAVNGKEIFEGDIVQVTYSDMEGETQVVENCIIKNIFNYDLREAAWLNHANEIKIVGNIHENKELLEATE